MLLLVPILASPAAIYGQQAGAWRYLPLAVNLLLQPLFGLLIADGTFKFVLGLTGWLTLRFGVAPADTRRTEEKLAMNDSDPIVDEIRRIREAHAARFNYDLQAIFQDIKEQQKRSGRTFVTFDRNGNLLGSTADAREEPEQITQAADVLPPLTDGTKPIASETSKG
jgi:hypothetical protein